MIRVLLVVFDFLPSHQKVPIVLIAVSDEYLKTFKRVCMLRTHYCWMATKRGSHRRRSSKRNSEREATGKLKLVGENSLAR